MLGDQLNRSHGHACRAHPDTTRILMVESADKISSKPFHRQRIHLIVTAMRRFAAELADEGFAVDYREEPSLTAGCEGHVRDYRPGHGRAAEPASAVCHCAPVVARRGDGAR